MTNDNLNVSMLSEDDMMAVEKELESLYGPMPGSPPVQHTNKALNSLFTNFGSERRTNKGNRIITAKMYRQMQEQNIQIEDEYIYMQSPDGSVSALPARKMAKWLGEGRRLIEETELEPQTLKNSKTTIHIEGKSYNIYFCDAKYSDCVRFFDSERGRNNHWKADHEGTWGKKRTSKKELTNA